MDSTGFVVGLSILFAVIGIVSSVVYYFARYYIKTDHTDKELLTKKPIEYGLAPKDLSPVVAEAPRTVSSALRTTKDSFWGRIARLATGGELPSEIRDQVEEILFSSDLGPKTADLLLTRVNDELTRSERQNLESVRAGLKTQMAELFSSVHRPDLWQKLQEGAKPQVWMIVGVNGAGKTTTIGKLASLARAKNLKTMIVAGDTFRAAADSQLRVWADRAGAEIYSAENTKDPSAVCYSGLERAKAAGVDLVLVDTAGRLHTQDHLMQELVKMKRVMTKVLPEAPHEALIVLDANAGQNALIQAQQFNSAVGLTGAVLTKMDGTAKGGMALGVVHDLQIPIVYIGIGESLEDLRSFDSAEFIEAVL
jgi:fused signal recognition particle receptor